MSGPIQLIPPGFLGFMQLKSGGKLPRDLAEVVSPTFDMLLWYMQTNAENLVDTALTIGDSTAFEQIGAFTVPQREWWFVHSFTTRVVAIVEATEYLAMAPGYVLEDAGGTPRVYMQGPWNWPEPVSPLVTSASMCSAHNFFAPPEAIFGVQVASEAPVGGFPAQSTIRFTRLPV